MKTLIDKGRIVTDRSTITSREVMEKFKRYLTLLDYCYVQYVPEQERNTVDQEIGRLLLPQSMSLTSGE